MSYPIIYDAFLLMMSTKAYIHWNSDVVYMHSLLCYSKAAVKKANNVIEN